MIPLRSARTFLVSGAIVALAGLTLAACGSSGGSSTASVQPPKTSAGTPATVGVTSTCTGACATFWPPLIAPGAPTTGSGANASLIGTTMRQDGKAQVTYNGHPVYLYSGDHNPGDTNGEGVVAFGASWFALSGSGSQVTGSASNAGSGSGGY